MLYLNLVTWCSKVFKTIYSIIPVEKVGAQWFVGETRMIRIACIAWATLEIPNRKIQKKQKKKLRKCKKLIFVFMGVFLKSVCLFQRRFVKIMCTSFMDGPLVYLVLSSKAMAHKEFLKKIFGSRRKIEFKSFELISDVLLFLSGLLKQLLLLKK